MDKCIASYEVHVNTCRLGISEWETRKCAYKGRILLVNQAGETKGFCKTHARMALEGFVDNVGNVVHPTDRANYNQGFCGKPPHLGEWKEVPSVES